jgi:hypothetical protein
MTSDQKSEPRRSAWDEAAAEGIDMSLIESTLRKTPLERIEAHERALALALELRKAMQERYGAA